MPLASMRIQRSPMKPQQPPNTVIALLDGSELDTKTSRGAGMLPAGASWIHCGVPPEPFALVRTQASFLALKPLSPPPKIVIRLVFWSYTARWPARPGGATPVGESWVQVGVPDR